MKKLLFLALSINLIFGLILTSCENKQKQIQDNQVNSHQVSFESLGEGGTIEAQIKDGESLTKSPSSVEHDKTVIFTAKNQENYTVDKWIVNDEEKTSEHGKPSIELKIEKDISVKVTFKFNAPQTHKLTFEVDGAEGGKIEAAYYDNGVKILSSPHNVEHGKKISFSASSNNGYEIEKWTKNNEVVNGVRQGYDIVVTEDVTVKVKFKKKGTPQGQCNVTFEVEGGVGGSIKAFLTLNGQDLGNSPTKVKLRTFINFKAEPSEGYEVEYWTKDGVKIQGLTSNDYNKCLVMKDVVVKVKFKPTTSG